MDHYQQQQQQQYSQPPHYQQGYPQQPQQHVPQQPNMAYTAPQGMNEKASAHDHTHNHSQKLPEQGTRGWAFGLFDCFSPLDICCISFWCPCYMFGKTYERNKTGDKEAGGMNGMCCGWYAAACCGVQGIVQCMQRQNTREKHGIEGGIVGDFFTSCCCSCCTLIQEEKESIVRVTGMDPKTGVAYQPVPQMAYH